MTADLFVCHYNFLKDITWVCVFSLHGKMFLFCFEQMAMNFLGVTN